MPIPGRCTVKSDRTSKQKDLLDCDCFFRCVSNKYAHFPYSNTSIPLELYYLQLTIGEIYSFVSWNGCLGNAKRKDVCHKCCAYFLYRRQEIEDGNVKILKLYNLLERLRFYSVPVPAPNEKGNEKLRNFLKVIRKATVRHTIHFMPPPSLSRSFTRWYLGIISSVDNNKCHTASRAPSAPQWIQQAEMNEMGWGLVGRKSRERASDNMLDELANFEM